MSIEVAAIVLLAAALHAGWNALIKVRGDRLIVMAVATDPAGMFYTIPPARIEQIVKLAMG